MRAFRTQQSSVPPQAMMAQLVSGRRARLSARESAASGAQRRRGSQRVCPSRSGVGRPTIRRAEAAQAAVAAGGGVLGDAQGTGELAEGGPAVELEGVQQTLLDIVRAAGIHRGPPFRRRFFPYPRVRAARTRGSAWSVRARPTT
ncbi:hypothetical protein ADK76_07820 [Streptomyces griseoflavus]|nr:hypothetical protein ADK76_07820 [Streptomyces griseoflavus]